MAVPYKPNQYAYFRPRGLELWKSTISQLTDPIDPRFVREFQESMVVRPVPEAFLQTMINVSSI